MNLLAAVGRIALGTPFVLLGRSSWQEPEARAAVASGTLDQLRTMVPLPEDDELLVKLNGAVQMGAGAALGLGVLPRLAALTLAGSLGLTTWAGHAFWTIEDPEQRTMQKLQFLKNLGMVGGLLAVAATPRRR